MNRVFDVLKPLASGMTVHLNGDDYYMSDSVLYKVSDTHGVYSGESLNSFINLCRLLTNEELIKLNSEYAKWLKS